MATSPRRSRRLQKSEKKSVEKVKRLRERRHKTDASNEEDCTDDNNNSSCSSEPEELVTPFRQLKARNNFTKVYNSYNMDRGLDCYEADFIDDSESLRTKPTKGTPSSLRKRKRRKSGAKIIESDEENGEEFSTPTGRRLSNRRRKFFSSSSEEEEDAVREKRQKRRLLKMDSDDDDDDDTSLMRAKSSRAKLLQEQKESKIEERMRELKESRTKVKHKVEDKMIEDIEQEQKDSFIVFDNEISHNESSDDEKDEYYDSDWIVQDDDCSLDEWGEATSVASLYNSLVIKMSFKSLVSESNKWTEAEVPYQLLLLAGGNNMSCSDLTDVLSHTTLHEADSILKDFSTTLLHIVIGLPWSPDQSCDQSFNGATPSNSFSYKVKEDALAHSYLESLHTFDNVWFTDTLKNGLQMRPSIIETAIWYRREKCTHYLIQLYKELSLNWRQSFKEEEVCNVLWPKNHLQLCLLSHHVLDTVETSSAAGIINIIFPCMEVEDVSEKDELGYTAVMYAVQLGDWETLSIFLKSHLVSFTIKDGDGRSLLHLAAASGNLLCIQQLLDYGHQVDCRDSNGWPPLLYAHFSGHEEAFLMLMEADPHQLSVLSELLRRQEDDNSRRKTAKVVRELLISLAHSESYYTLFNKFVCSNLSVLDDESFGFMKHCMSLLSFENKKEWLKQKLQILSSEEDEQEGAYYSRLTLHNLRRSQIVTDVLSRLEFVTSNDYRRGPPDVTFKDEPGICTGPRKEFWTCLSHELAKGEGNIFISSDDSQLSLQPYEIIAHNLPNTLTLSSSKSLLSSLRSPPVSINDHLYHINIIGSLLATAVMYNDTLDCNLSVPLIKQLLGQSVSNDDLESIDADLYRNLTNLKNESVEGLDLTFTTSLVCPWNGKLVDINLSKRAISDEPVTDDNKLEYIDCLTQFQLEESIKSEIKKLQEGFWKVIPKRYISAFTPNELSLLLSGIPSIDVKDWKNNTTVRVHVKGCSSKSIVDWFWSLVNDLDENEKGLLLKFCTGSPRLPPGGFACLKGLGGSNGFTLSLGSGLDKIPHAQTCFNVLVLSNYTSEQELRNKVLIAIRYGCEGFAFS